MTSLENHFEVRIWFDVNNDGIYSSKQKDDVYIKINLKDCRILIKDDASGARESIFRAWARGWWDGYSVPNNLLQKFRMHVKSSEMPISPSLDNIDGKYKFLRK